MINARRRLIVASLIAAAVALLALAGSATAKNAVFTEFSGIPESTQAGGHPDVRLIVGYEIDADVGAGQLACEPVGNCLSPRIFSIHWPTGFIGNPHVTPKCTLADFSQKFCPVDAQVGVAEVAGEEFGQKLHLWVPIYNMETRPDQAGQIGFTLPVYASPQLIDLSGRTDSDYGLDAVSGTQVRVPFNNFGIHLWGVPQDPVHDPERFFTPLSGFFLACITEFLTPGIPGCPPSPFLSATYAKATTPEAPFLQNPTTCGVPLTMSGDIEYYDGRTSHAETSWPATTGCSQASFTPSMAAKPTTSRTDTVTGLDIDLKVPQTQAPHTPAPSELKASRVTLPEGFTLNPGAADGKLACGELESMIGTLFAASCPEFSKIATSSIDVSALPAPIPGAVYLAKPQPGDPYPFVLTGDGFGTHVKLHGSTVVDPQTGRVTLVLENLPQSPLQEFNLHIFGSERGIFATPNKCGTYTVESEFVPWNSDLETRHLKSFMTLDSGPNGAPCPSAIGPRPFSPDLAAGMANNTGGMHSPFSVTLNRNDGDQNITGLNVTTPRGFSATLRGIPYCPTAAIAQLFESGYSGVAEQGHSACPAASEIGSATAAGGPGTHPVYVGGKVYLAGPYKGAPLSLVVVIPAVSGPYDLGVIPVRAAINVDPVTAEVTAVSDPLPQILGGIPLRTRFVQVNLDRPDFALNPTNCDPSAVTAAVSGDEGGIANLANHFQVSNCARLPYGPQLSLNLRGGVNRRGHPAIHSVLANVPGEANTKAVTVTLPKGELLDNGHIGTVCTRVDFAKRNCPAQSVIGDVTATTPILDKPLTGSVYLRSSSNKLPDLVLDLHGQVDFQAAARIDSVKGRLRTTFESLPDVPISSVELNLAGGAKGLLQNSVGLCGNSKMATVRLLGQNGADVTSKVGLQVSCGSKARHKRHHSRKAVH
jgi:hypothetical protein